MRIAGEMCAEECAACCASSPSESRACMFDCDWLIERGGVGESRRESQMERLRRKGREADTPADNDQTRRMASGGGYAAEIVGAESELLRRTATRGREAALM